MQCPGGLSLREIKGMAQCAKEFREPDFVDARDPPPALGHVEYNVGHCVAPYAGAHKSTD